MTESKFNKSIAFYTVFFGGDDNWAKLVPDLPTTKHDCYYFTNNRQLYNRLTWSNYRSVFMNDIPVHDDPIKDALAAKELKACPHHSSILSKYDYTCYTDSKLGCDAEKVIKLIEELDQSDQCAIFSKHSCSDTFHSVWDEYKLCLQFPKYASQKDQYKAYLEKYLNHGFSEHIDTHYCTGFIVRKNSPKTIEMCDLWYDHIKECGIECQISFSLVQQLYKDIIKPVDYKYCYKFI